MRNEVARKILEETPTEVREFVRKYADAIINEDKHSFARSQAIEFLKWYKKLKFYSKFGRTTGMLYSLFLAHQAKQKEGGII